MFISPRLSTDSVLELIRASDSHFFLVDESQSDILTSISSGVPSVKVLHVKDVVQETSNDTAPRIPFWKKEDVDAEVDKPLYFMHTSGSTGGSCVFYLVRSWILIGACKVTRN